MPTSLRPPPVPTRLLRATLAAVRAAAWVRAETIGRTLIFRYRMYEALEALAVGIVRSTLPFARWGWPAGWILRLTLPVLRVSEWVKPRRNGRFVQRVMIGPKTSRASPPET